MNQPKFKKGDKVLISSEAVADSELTSNEGTIKKLFNETAYGSYSDGEKVPDYKLAEIEFANGLTSVVGQHEISLR